MFWSDGQDLIIEIRVLETILSLLVANVFAGSLVTEAIEGGTSMLVIVIDVKAAKTVASFLTAPDKSLNSDLFYYNYNTW